MRGARFVVVTDVNPFRLELANEMGASVALNVNEGTLTGRSGKRLGMTEGFDDRSSKMSGKHRRLREMQLANMSHGAKIAMLEIRTAKMSIDWRTVVFNMLTIKGIYGREMYETWYKMTVMLQSGLLDIRPVDHAPLPLHRFPQGLRGDDQRPGREGDPQFFIRVAAGFRAALDRNLLE